jgi:hypothetical protein
MPRNDLCGGGRVPDPQFLELGDQVVHQLNADPFIEIWGAFTFVCDISPMRIAFTLVQFSAADDKKAEASRSGIPAPVLSGLAERCLGAALAQMDDGERIELLAAKRHDRWRKDAESRLVAAALREFSVILRDELRRSVAIGDEDIAPYLEKAIQRLPRDLQLPGRRTREARDTSELTNALAPIGSVGGQQIFMANLPETDEKQLATRWRADWADASRPWKIQEGVELWRCGGAVFAIGNPILAGTVVTPRYPEVLEPSHLKGHQRTS